MAAPRADRAADPAQGALRSFPDHSPLGLPDFRGLPALVAGPCPTCSFTLGTRTTLHHEIGVFSRLRLYCRCPQCGADLLWDSRVCVPRKPEPEPSFAMSMAQAIQAWFAA